MRQYRDETDRVVFELSDDHCDFEALAQRMVDLHGSPVEKLSGLEERYWDFEVDGATVVLHADSAHGVTLHADSKLHEAALRAVAGELRAGGDD